MANFHTHMTVAAATSGLASTIALKVGYIGSADAFFLTIAGTIGGILPDVDLKYSHPSRITFSLLGTFLALLAVFATSRSYTVVELWVLGFLTFWVVRYPVWQVFHALTVHRGAVHSVAAGIFVLFLANVLAFTLLELSSFYAWLMASFVFFGFMVHLILDEISSVDFMNQRVKRSFGSALKLVDVDKKFNSAMIVGATIVLWFFTSDLRVFFAGLLQPPFGEALTLDVFLPSYILAFFEARLSR